MATSKVYNAVSYSQSDVVKYRYYPSIDGLRAVAVCSVVVFHLNKSLLHGGFTGVDIFFVISGYLITYLMISDLDSGQFSLPGFYQRRIARIAPAAFLVIIVTLALGYFVYTAQDFASLGAASLAAALSVINIKLLYQGSYFAASPDAQPLLHYWSLAVEEQFYIIFPIIMIVIFRLKKVSIYILFLLMLLSLAACIVVTPRAPTAAFYLLPTRAWELLAGACLAVLKRRNPIFLARAATVTIPAGTLLIAASLIWVTSAGFPGWMAILPVMGSTLVLAGADSPSGGIGQRLLSNYIFVYLGKRSYSLYLWHWPIFSFVDYQFYMQNGYTISILKIIATLGATELSYNFVERPARISLNLRKNRIAAYAAFSAVAIAISLVGSSVRSHFYLSADPHDIASGGIVANPGGKYKVVVIGDSQGAMYGYYLASLAKDLNFRLNVLSSAGRNELPDDPDTLWPHVDEFLKQAHPDIAIVAQAWSLKAHDPEYLSSALDSIGRYVPQVIVLTQPPRPPKEASRESIRADLSVLFNEEPDARDSRLNASKMIHQFESSKVDVVDVDDLLTDSNGRIRFIGPDGRVTYYDATHLSDTGTDMVKMRIKQAIEKSLNALKP